VAYIFFYLHVYYEPMQGTCGQKKTTKKTCDSNKRLRCLFIFCVCFL